MELRKRKTEIIILRAFHITQKYIYIRIWMNWPALHAIDSDIVASARVVVFQLGDRTIFSESWQSRIISELNQHICKLLKNRLIAAFNKMKSSSCSISFCIDP